MDRSIVHLNVADFAVAVERVLDRRLAGRPVIVAPAAAARARVYDMSDEAFAAGVRKQMPLAQALRLCPDARLVPPRIDCYRRAMADLVRRARDVSPLVETGIADGHLFVDLTGTGRLLGPAVDAAWRLQRRIRNELALAPIWAVAANKLVAKVASRLVKPLGEYIVPPGDEQAFLAPVPLHLVPGIEAGDLQALARLNLHRAGQVAALSPAQLAVVLDRRADHVARLVRGCDTAPVLPAGSRPAEAAAEHVLCPDTCRPETVAAALFCLVEQVGRRLRQSGRAAGLLALEVEHSDGVCRHRQKACRPPSANDLVLAETADRLLAAAWIRRVRLRRLRLAARRLVHPPLQQPLFADARRREQRQASLVAAVDRIRDRFGAPAVRFGRTLAVTP